MLHSNFPTYLRLFAILGAFVLSSGIAAAQASAPKERVFTVLGVVRAPFANGSIRIEHEEIPGFMPAMTMPFFTTEEEAGRLQVGDRVEFEFRVSNKSRATNFKVTGREAPSATAIGTAKENAPFRRLREGDVVPEFMLVDQAGRKFDAGQLRGRPTIVTFVFTRCPVPEFCPLLGRKFRALQDELTKRGDKDVQLLSITIDPEHDQPEILREYGESLGADFTRWKFATGSAGQIERLTRLFAVRVEKNAATLDHTLATALIGPDGKIVEIWRGNAWQPQEILQRLKP